MLEFEEKWKPPLQGCANPTKKILHRDDIDVSKKHKKTKKIVCPSHDKHLKKIKNKKNPRCQQQADFFSSPKKKTQKLCFFCLKWKIKKKRDRKVLKSKVKSFFQAENKKAKQSKKAERWKKSSKLSPIFYTPLYKQFKPIFITTEKQNKNRAKQSCQPILTSKNYSFPPTE